MSERLSSPEQPERLCPNEAQEDKLRQLCDAYRVEYDPDHYFVYDADSSMMPLWTEGWVGGDSTTLYVGVSPEGQAHS